MCREIRPTDFSQTLNNCVIHEEESLNVSIESRSTQKKQISLNPKAEYQPLRKLKTDRPNSGYSQKDASAYSKSFNDKDTEFIRDLYRKECSSMENSRILTDSILINSDCILESTEVRRNNLGKNRANQISKLSRLFGNDLNCVPNVFTIEISPKSSD